MTTTLAKVVSFEYASDEELTECYWYYRMTSSDSQRTGSHTSTVDQTSDLVLINGHPIDLRLHHLQSDSIFNLLAPTEPYLKTSQSKRIERPPINCNSVPFSHSRNSLITPPLLSQPPMSLRTFIRVVPHSRQTDRVGILAVYAVKFEFGHTRFEGIQFHTPHDYFICQCLGRTE